MVRKVIGKLHVKNRYKLETGSKQVPCGKDEKSFEHRVRGDLIC